jgi:hypothetical protein
MITELRRNFNHLNINERIAIMKLTEADRINQERKANNKLQALECYFWLMENR